MYLCIVVLFFLFISSFVKIYFKEKIVYKQHICKFLGSVVKTSLTLLHCRSLLRFFSLISYICSSPMYKCNVFTFSFILFRHSFACVDKCFRLIYTFLLCTFDSFFSYLAYERFKEFFFREIAEKKNNSEPLNETNWKLMVFTTDLWLSHINLY